MTEREAETRERLAREATREERRHRTGGHQRGPHKATLIAKWADQEWRRQWETKARGHRETTWQTPWNTPTIPLYEGLSKAESTALFLLRTEVLGLNAWLATIGVPGVLPRCSCGWPTQTVRHVLLHCPRYARMDLVAQLPSEQLHEILTQPKSAQATARWFVRSGALPQFRTAKEIDAEDTGGFRPFQDLGRWQEMR